MIITYAKYHRYYVEGGTYFFTVVTDERKKLFADESSRVMLGDAIRVQQTRMPFEVMAIVLLPDHLHCIWSLPQGDCNYSLRWAQIKERFTRSYLKAGGEEATRSHARMRHRQRSVWQPRFWEQTIIDEIDFKRCLDYIHWNPVKHGLVSRPCDYGHSSFHKYVRLGEYDLNWGTGALAYDLVDAEWD